jgi:hypothetical protein
MEYIYFLNAMLFFILIGFDIHLLQVPQCQAATTYVNRSQLNKLKTFCRYKGIVPNLILLVATRC